MPESSRQLAAIMFTDIVGYTALMQANELDGKSKAKHYRQVLTEQVALHKGNVIQNYGDGSLTIFTSAVEAAECAISIQSTLRVEPIVPLRIGIHLGDIVIDGEDFYGDGINVAARIESMGVEGAILISQSVYNQIKNHKSFQLTSLGRFDFKNVTHPIEVFAIANEGMIVPNPATLQGKFKVAEKAEKSIAVLPFVNMSSDSEQEFFSDGISEEIINTIVQLPNLKVAGRTSSFSFKGKNEDLRVIGKELGVKNVLEGSVRKFANKVRITAQLIEVSSGFHLWSKKYDRELDDVFKIQDEIALEIAAQLKITLAGAESIPKTRQQTQSIEAYQLYYKGRSFFYKRGTALSEALKCFELALKIDPNYALALSGLADTYIMLCFHGYLSTKECWSKAISASKKALQYGPDLGETHNTMAVIALLKHRNLEEAGREFKLALKLNPTHLQARVWYGMFFLAHTKGDFKEGIEQLKIAVENDPLSAYAHACLSLTLTTGGKFEEAILIAQKAIALDPKSMITRYALCYCNLWSGKLKEAIEESLIALDVSNRHVWILQITLLTYLKLNKRKEATEISNEMEAMYRNQNLLPANMALAAAAMGNEEYALELSKKAIEIDDPYINFLVTLRDGKVLCEIPGFENIKQMLGYDASAQKPI